MTLSSRLPILVAALLSMTLAAAGCGGGNSSDSASTGPDPNMEESSPPGDIPDNQAFIPYSPQGAQYSVKVPEGWSRSSSAGGVTFTDKLNSITVNERPATRPMTVQEATQVEVPKLARTTKGFEGGTVTTVQRNAGPAILITYTADGQPNPVTGKAVTDAVERYIFFHNGQALVLTLSGPKGADNVDPWATVTGSVKWAQ